MHKNDWYCSLIDGNRGDGQCRYVKHNGNGYSNCVLPIATAAPASATSPTSAVATTRPDRLVAIEACTQPTGLRYNHPRWNPTAMPASSPSVSSVRRPS